MILGSVIIGIHLIKTGKRSQDASLSRGTPSRQKCHGKRKDTGTDVKILTFPQDSHLLHNHGFQVVSSRQKCPSCISLVFLMPRYRPWAFSPLIQPSFFLGMGFPWNRAPEENRWVLLAHTGTEPHYFSLVPHSPPPQRFCTGRDQSKYAHFSSFQ